MYGVFCYNKYSFSYTTQKYDDRISDSQKCSKLLERVSSLHKKNLHKQMNWGGGVLHTNAFTNNCDLRCERAAHAETNPLASTISHLLFVFYLFAEINNQLESHL